MHAVNAIITPALSNITSPTNNPPPKDQRNHGTREIYPLANESWNKSNPHHAQDMFGITTGTVLDTSLLIDALPGYLFLPSSSPSPSPPPVFDQNLVLGVSLGGHSTWQSLFTNPAVTSGVSIIGCPDFPELMRDRARLSKRDSYHGTKTAPGGFWGRSRDFPEALVRQCGKFDPRGIVFGCGTGKLPEVGAMSAEERERVRAVLDRTVKGKRFLMCSGAADKLVPWRCSEAFTRFFVDAAEGWYKDGGLRVDNRLYEGVGHECSDGMVVDAVKFVCEEVTGFGTGTVGAKI